MKRIYTVLFALSFMIIGFALSSFISRSSLPMPMSTYLFPPKSSVIRVVKGTLTNDNSYYLNIIQYGTDSVTVTSVDSINMRCGTTIQYYNAANYEFLASHSGIDSIPRSVYAPVTTYTLFDSTIYTRYGVLYATDNTGKPQTFNTADIASIQQGSPGSGTVVVGVVSIDVFE